MLRCRCCGRGMGSPSINEIFGVGVRLLEGQSRGESWKGMQWRGLGMRSRRRGSCGEGGRLSPFAPSVFELLVPTLELRSVQAFLRGRGGLGGSDQAGGQGPGGRRANGGLWTEHAMQLERPQIRRRPGKTARASSMSSSNRVNVPSWCFSSPRVAQYDCRERGVSGPSSFIPGRDTAKGTNGCRSRLTV